MKHEGHLKKAKAFEKRASRWDSDEEAPSVIEDIFDAVIHYLAYGINIKYARDIDSHNIQKRFLKERGEFDVYNTVNNMESLRIASVYGGAWNGERIRKALEHLDEAKEWIKKIGGSID